MKRVILEATDENVLKSIKENTYNRRTDIKDFIEALESIEGNMFISLDARWGEGKTFYVRQIEKTLEYLTKKTWGNEEIGSVVEEVEILSQYFKNTPLDSISLTQSYLPMYYNAWLYDNHDDPLLSLILMIAKKIEGYLDTSISTKVSDKLAALLTVPSLTINNLRFSMDGNKMKNAIEGKDILKCVKSAEEIRRAIKDILNEVIVERAEKLVIFIDELDRCKPSYAIEMLERIKHYFDDERIIFVVSVNKEQLIHTISKYYGSGFDSTGYLNKFFDLNVHMPVLSIDDIGRLAYGTHSSRQHHLIQIADALNEYYKLSIRDAMLFKQRVTGLPVNYVNDTTAQGCCLSLFIPIIAILDIKDENEKVKFLNGDSQIIEVLSKGIPEIKDMMIRFGDRNVQNAYETGLQKFNETYQYVFKNNDDENRNELVLHVNSDLKNICIKLYNGYVIKES